MPELKFGDTLDPVALYAAVVSTIVLLWEWFKWWRGEASFEVTANPNMFDLSSDIDQINPLIAIEVRNTGKVPTTITHVVLMAYKSPVHRLFDKPAKKAIVNSGTAQRVPCEVQSGGRFLATGQQNDLVIGWSQHYALYAGVSHTLSRRPLLARIRPLKTETSN